MWYCLLFLQAIYGIAYQFTKYLFYCQIIWTLLFHLMKKFGIHSLICEI